jgi:hypothetical protein
VTNIMLMVATCVEWNVRGSAYVPTPFYISPVGDAYAESDYY